MLNIKSGKHFTDAPTMTRGGFLKGILASGIAPSLTLGAVSLAGSANASVGGMMRNVGARQAAMFGEWKKPYDYEVEWIRSSGTQFLDVGLLPKIGDSFTCEFSYDIPIYWPAQDCLLSSGTGDYQLILLSGIDSNELKHGGFWYKYFSTGSASDFNFYPDVDVFYKVSVSETGIANIGNYYASSYAISLTNTNLFLLKRANNSNYFRGRLKSFVLKRDSVKIRDLIPVVKDGVGYMYDRCGSICQITGTSLYANAGTGAFTWG